MSPVARTKYPELHKGPPHVISFISGRSFISRTADTLFKTRTSSAGLNRGGALTNSCTWSGITSCSTIRNPYRSAVPLNIRLSVLATGSFNIARRYFGTQTTWYLSSYTAWLVRFIFHASYCSIPGSCGGRLLRTRKGCGIRQWNREMKRLFNQVIAKRR